jgi:hypothetical protein
MMMVRTLEKKPGTRYMGFAGKWYVVLNDGRHVEYVPERRAA